MSLSLVPPLCPFLVSLSALCPSLVLHRQPTCSVSLFFSDIKPTSERKSPISFLQLSMNLGQWVLSPSCICIVNLRIEGKSFLMEHQQGLSSIFKTPETVHCLALNLSWTCSWANINTNYSLPSS